MNNFKESLNRHYDSASSASFGGPRDNSADISTKEVERYVTTDGVEHISREHALAYVAGKRASEIYQALYDKRDQLETAVDAILSTEILASRKGIGRSGASSEDLWQAKRDLGFNSVIEMIINHRAVLFDPLYEAIQLADLYGNASEALQKASDLVHVKHGINS